MVDETETTEKEYSGFLMIDWRGDDVRFRKTEPSDLSPSEVAVPVSVSVNVPKVEVPGIDVGVDIPAASVEHAIVEDAERIDPSFDEGDE